MPSGNLVRSLEGPFVFLVDYAHLLHVLTLFPRCFSVGPVRLQTVHTTINFDSPIRCVEIFFGIFETEIITNNTACNGVFFCSAWMFASFLVYLHVHYVHYLSVYSITVGFSSILYS